MPRPLTIVGLLTFAIALFAGGWLARGVINGDDDAPVISVARDDASSLTGTGATIVAERWLGDQEIGFLSRLGVCDSEDYYDSSKTVWVVKCTTPPFTEDGLALSVRLTVDQSEKVEILSCRPEALCRTIPR